MQAKINPVIFEISKCTYELRLKLILRFDASSIIKQIAGFVTAVMKVVF